MIGNIIRFAGEFLKDPDVYIRIGRYLLSAMRGQVVFSKPSL
jgi:hypothetical protein